MHLVGCFIGNTVVKFNNIRNPKNIDTFPSNIPPRPAIYSHNGRTSFVHFFKNIQTKAKDTHI